MPSDALIEAALEAVRTRADAFRSAVTEITAQQLRGKLDAQRIAAAGTTEHTSARLGAFAAGRINADRFARVLDCARPAGADRSAVFAGSLAVLQEIERRGDDVFRVRVEPGGDLHAAVEDALAVAGRAFLAARLASNSGGELEDDQAPWRGFPFRRWSQAERRLAPPLVIEIEGGDLVPAGLASYLDGSACFVLLVSGPAPPAALARAIAPGVLVGQANDAEVLQLLTSFAGPAAIAIMPPEAARFVHLPAGDGFGAVEVTQAPQHEPRRPIGSVSVGQQRQDILLLDLLANCLAQTAAAAAADAALNGPELAAVGTGRSNGVHPVGAIASVDPVATLAEWLLARVDLSGLEGGGG